MKMQTFQLDYLKQNHTRSINNAHKLLSMLLHKIRIVKAQYKETEYIIQHADPQQHIYTTEDHDVICMIRPINTQQQKRSYQKLKKLLIQLRHINIIGMVDYAEIEQGTLGCLFLENCYHNLKKFIENSDKQIEEGLILKIMNDVLKGLQFMHLGGITHMNLTLQSIVESEEGTFKISKLNNVIIGSIIISPTNREQTVKNIQLKTNRLYQAPQQINLNMGDQIGTKVDIFAFGVVLYLLCYKKFPFDSKSSVINKKYEVPQNPRYSTLITSVIDQCLALDPKKRPTAERLLSQFVIKTRTRKFSINQDKRMEMQYDELDEKLNKLKNWVSTHRKYSEGNDFSIFSSIKKLFNQLTTQTQSWIMNFIENNDSIPPTKYNRFIISKCWQKPYKVAKVYQILERQISNSPKKSFCNLKILILLHNFLRKGPQQTVTNQMYPTAFSISQKIYNNWADIGKQKGHPFLVLIIQAYCLILKQKIKIGSKYSMFIEGNYCLRPFFTIPTDKKILSISFLISLRSYLEKLSIFHEAILKQNVVQDIQRSIVLSVVDEQYCLLSLLVHLYSAFKESTNYFQQEVDKSNIVHRINDFDRKLQILFYRLSGCFEKANKFSSLFQNKLILDPEVINYIKNIPILEKKKSFNIKHLLNYETNIHGIKIPRPYEQVTKNPNFLKTVEQSEKCQNFMQIDGFKKKTSLIANRFTFDTTNTEMKSTQRRFQQFDFKTKSKQLQQKPNKKHPIMQFTHQNLNNDFQQKINFKAQHIKQFLSLGCESHLSGSILFVDQKAQDRSNMDLLEIQQSQYQTQKTKLQKFQKLDSKKKQQKLQNLQHVFKKNSFQTSNSRSGIVLQNFVTQEVIKNANQYIIQYNQLKLSQLIGRGHSSEVFKGEWRGQIVAVKKISLTEDSLVKQFTRQLATTIKLRPHLNLVTLIGVSQHNSEFFIVNEYCKGGNLFSLLHKSNVQLSWEVRVSLAKQIAQGMMFLHTNVPPSVHRDLKSLNILLVDDYKKQTDNLKIKIGDFGLSREISDMFMTGVLGTYHWMAPQIFNNSPYTMKADVYSYGIVLYEILSRRTPYSNIETIHALIKYVGIQNGRPDLSIISTDCPVNLKLLMMNCWSMNPKDRPTFAQILQKLNEIQLPELL